MSPGRGLAAAALTAVITTLSSCITATMWHPVRQTETRELLCENALVVAGAGSQLAMRLDVHAAMAIGVEPRPDSGTWIILQPDDPTLLDTLLQWCETGKADEQLVVAFRPASGAEPRQVQMWLSPAWSLAADDADQGRISAMQLRQDRGPRVLCSWRSATVAPAGRHLATPRPLVYDWRAEALGTAAKVVLTPLTAACDLVLLPFEVLGTTLFWLAD